jgi:hypothetical protein
MTAKPFSALNKYFVVEWALVVSSSILLAIWPLPGTIALRHLVLLTGFLSACQIIRRSNVRWSYARCWPVWIFFGFFAWMIFHLIFLSTDYPEQLRELTSLWLRAFLAAVLGLGLGLVIWHSESSEYSVSFKINKDWATSFLIAGFGGTVIIFFVRYLYEIYLTRAWWHFDFYMTPYAGKPPIVIFGAIFFTLILIRFKDALLKKLTWRAIVFLGLCLFLVIFAEFFSNTKNGMVILLVPLTIFIITFIYSISWNLKKIIIGVIIIAPIVLTTSYIIKKHIESNAAWPMLISDLKIAVNIDVYSSWKSAELYPYPLNNKGITVNGSTYDRAAWAVASSRLIRENPLGYGLVHHSFGALAIKKWPDFYRPIGKFRRASHSGLLDFTLGVGIPGLILVLIPFGAAFYRASNQTYFWMQFIRWIFPVLLIAYLITEVSNNHFIELLFFIVAFCIGITLIPVQTERSYSK